MRLAIVLVAILAVPALAHAATLKVPSQYPTIQNAIDAAVDGDTVMVAPGTYFENIDFTGKDITVKSSGGPGLTVIDGNQLGSVVSFKNGETVNAVLEGFTITNGSGMWSTYGGGIISENYSTPTIKGNIISGNTTSNGGGMWCYYSSANITGNIFAGNKAIKGGGGLSCSNASNGIITNNIFLDNIADENGGGINCYGSSPVITNNTFFGNTSLITGGAIALIVSSPVITNSIMWGNYAPQDPEIHLASGNPTITFCNVLGGWTGAGNIDQDPLYVDSNIGDFHLLHTSPCRDGGDNLAPSLPSTDFEGDSRVAYGTVDMGADEFYTHLYWTGDATPGGSVKLNFVGLPGTTPVQLWLGSGVMDPPIHTKYGDWYLKFPIFLGVTLGSIPGPNGVLTFPATLHPTTPTPLSLAFQSGIGLELTNLSVMKVE